MPTNRPLSNEKAKPKHRLQFFRTKEAIDAVGFPANWPTKTELDAGCRFLNPCEEMDYGEQIFEDSLTHKLVGVTPAAKWHIRICGLNGDRLIEERHRRARHWKTIQNRAIRVKKSASHEVVQELITSFREEVELMIPKIPPPPKK